MKIADIETHLVSLPLRRPHTWAGNYSPVGQRYLLVKLILEDGTYGWGEAQVLKDWGGEFGTRYGEMPETAIPVIRDYLAPLLKGEDVERFEYLHLKMDKFIRGYPYAKAAIDVAMYDAAGKLLGVPVYQLLGGLVRDRIPVAHSIGLMDVDAAVTEAKQVFDEGVGCIKVKVGLDAERDLRLVRLIREALPELKIRVDANQGYTSWKEALQVTNRMAEYGIWFMEQPVEGLEAMARVAQATEIPIMADEGCWNAHDLLRLVRNDACEMISCYYTKAGGLTKAKSLLSLAHTAGVFADVNGSAEMGIGNAANLHIAAACPAVTIPGTIPITQTEAVRRTEVACRIYLDDLIDRPFEYADGFMTVPDRPGLGVDIDPEKFAKYRVGG
ncbi:mandelate racemase/muconate lactonizing enzyme family protein [Amorphus sp. MBR-141]